MAMLEGLLGSVRPVQDEELRVRAGGEGGVDLAGGEAVATRPLLIEDLPHGQAGVGLDRPHHVDVVLGVGGHQGLPDPAVVLPQLTLGGHEDRRPELLGQLDAVELLDQRSGRPRER